MVGLASIMTMVALIVGSPSLSAKMSGTEASSHSELLASGDDGLVKVMDNYKIGFADKTGKVVIPCNYDMARDFHEGLAAVASYDKGWGYIDESGNMVIPYRYRFVSDFSEGLACVINLVGASGLSPWGTPAVYGYIDKSGKEVIPVNHSFTYDYPGIGVTDVVDIMKFSDGMAPSKGEGMSYGFIDKSGNLVIGHKYDSVQPFKNGVAGVMDSSGNWGAIDKTGKTVVPFSYSTYNELKRNLPTNKVASASTSTSTKASKPDADTSSDGLWISSFVNMDINGSYANAYFIQNGTVTKMNVYCGLDSGLIPGKNNDDISSKIKYASVENAESFTGWKLPFGLYVNTHYILFDENGALQRCEGTPSWLKELSESLGTPTDDMPQWVEGGWRFLGEGRYYIYVATSPSNVIYHGRKTDEAPSKTSSFTKKSSFEYVKNGYFATLHVKGSTNGDYVLNFKDKCLVRYSTNGTRFDIEHDSSSKSVASKSGKEGNQDSVDSDELKKLEKKAKRREFMKKTAGFVGNVIKEAYER